MYIPQGLTQGKRGPSSLQPMKKGVQHVYGFVRNRKYLARFFHLGWDTVGFKECDGGFNAQGRKCRVQKLTWRAIRLNDTAIVSRLRDVAPRAARHQNLHAWLAVLLQQERSLPALRSPDRSHEPCGAGP